MSHRNHIGLRANTVQQYTRNRNRAESIYIKYMLDSGVRVWFNKSRAEESGTRKEDKKWNS